MACASGPRAVEAGLLAEVAAACELAKGDPAQLAQPLRVVVSSRPIRDDLLRAIVECAGGQARLGVRVQTLESLAREVLDRAGVPAASARLYPEAVRDRARREPALARDLDRLDDGYAAVVASVDDLLDAGFTEAHAEALRERVAEAAAGALRARADALLRVASDLSRELAAASLGHRAAEIARASDLLRAGGAHLLPASALWIHGFADATGVQLDLLETLVQRFGARVWLDRPEAPRAAQFGARLRERLAPEFTELAVPSAPEALLRASRHLDPEREARAAAAWARERVDAGIAPERVAIVARDLARHGLALRRQLRRFGVPFSGCAERGAATPAGRRLAALCELIERGGALHAERWLESLGAVVVRSAPRPDLRDALHVLGIATLADLAAAPVGVWAHDVPLPARMGFALDAGGAPSASHRSATRAQLNALQQAALATLRLLEGEPVRAPFTTRVARLEELVAALGWSSDTTGSAELAAAFADAERDGDRALRREDWPRLLRRELAELGTDPIGGCGGGVQVLTVMEARSRSFAALRLIGLVRGVFPRRISEDPLLPDALRRPLRDVLPDLPIKGEGHEEERFLFAQLLAAAPEVHLSCAQRDARGRATPPSPLFERAASSRIDESELDPCSSRDAVLEVAQHGTRADFAAALPAALAEGRRALGLPGAPPHALASARLAVLRELDPRDARRRELGPYLGIVGPPRGAADPRRRPPSITQLESVARCPWRQFLERILHVEPAPDAWGALPAASDPRLLGNVVHAALALASASNAWPDSVPGELLLEAAREQTAREGIALPGFAHALARSAAPYVEVARRLDASERAVLRGVEIDEIARIRDANGAERELRYRADRVDEVGGALRRTDWKTGKAKSLQDHRNGLARGDLIQVHAYAQDGARARYVYLHPDLDDAKRVLDADAIDPGRAAFDASAAVLLAGLDAGAFVPRLRRPDRDEESTACRNCDHRPACVRGDSGTRIRLGQWADAGAGSSELERAALALWRLGSEP